MRHTSAYNPKANGKVENSHATLYDILRSMVSRWGSNWAQHLSLAEFAFNSSVCASTGFTPFQVAYGRNMAFPGDLCGIRSEVPRAEAAATRIIALTTACRDHFESSQMDNQEKVSRRPDVPIKVGDLVLLSTANLVSLKKKGACPRLASRFVGPFRVISPPEGEVPPPGGPIKNYVWLALPLTFGDIRQPLSLSRLRRFVERPAHLGGQPLATPLLSLAATWARHAGKTIDSVSQETLAEFCVGHSLELSLPPDYFPLTHATMPYAGPRRVRVYDAWRSTGNPHQVAVFLLDLPLVADPNKMAFETAVLPVRPVAHLPAAYNWSLSRALAFSFPDAVYLKDLLPGADHSVVFQQTLFPIHQVVAERTSGGAAPSRELLVQFTKEDYENSAWIKEKYVPKRYLDEFWERVDGGPAANPAPA